LKEGVFAAIRRNCHEVAERARLVEIDVSALRSYADSLPLERMVLPEMDPAIHYLGHGADTVAYYLTLDTINYGSGYFPEVFGDPRRSGYRTVAAALTARFAESGPVPPKALRSLTPIDCARMIDLQMTNPAAVELVTLYSKSLNDLGAFICDRFGGTFVGIIEEAGASAAGMVELVSSLRDYHDMLHYDGREVPFYKRAQLLAIDLYIAFQGEGWGRFGDIDEVTICADNLVPHVLRVDGVLSYAPELAERVDRGELIDPGSQEEVEIRACAVHAGELLVAELRQRGIPTNAMLLDNFLWHRGQEPVYRVRPRHRTRTVFY
jgi:hypothetical protein